LRSWGDKYPRKVTWALLATKKGGRQVLVLNTHLTEGKGAKQKNLRLQGAETIHAWLAEHVKPDKKGRVIPVIVTGDFNTDAGTKPHDELAEAADLRLRDVWEVASPPGRLPGTYNGFKGLTTKSRIDWVLVGPSVGVLGAGKIEEQVDGRWPSDHYPVYADLEIQ
jgi:endonuclease/exonuclease/phosphatase family metal-dependent hydrolase